MVDETRYKRALELLKDANLSITELALELGYGYPVSRITVIDTSRIAYGPMLG